MPSDDPMMGLKKPFGFSSDPDPKAMGGLRGPYSWAKNRKTTDSDTDKKPFGLAKLPGED
jgi:hypothetical protein